MRSVLIERVVVGWMVGWTVTGCQDLGGSEASAGAGTEAGPGGPSGGTGSASASASGGHDGVGSEGLDSDGSGDSPPNEPPDGDGIAGVLDCPTVELPPYRRGVDASLSAPFALSCGSCHGVTGEGNGSYPPIPGDLSLSAFIDIVREGKGAMPAFSEQFVSDAELEADYASLQLLAEGADEQLLPSGGEWTWTEAQVDEAYARGLEVWRTPDEEGIACANCHSPDGIDLAVIGYPDDAILRRAGLHLPADEAARVVDFVHAQRRRFGLGRACSPSWRPLQPGGEVLPGDTPEEQDTAFAEQLVDMDYLIVNGAVETLADADAAFAQLRDTDLRTLPIGIALPRWSEDGFNGEEHRTINDYLPGIGRVPNDPESWYALQSAYIEDPTDEALLDMLRRFPAETNDQGYAASAEEANHLANGRCNHLRNSGGFLGFTDLKKMQSQFIVQHFMRMAVLGRAGWNELSLAPFASYGDQLNPFYRMGSALAEFNCRNAADMLATWPPEPAEEIPASDLEGGVAEEMSRQLNHPWQTLGQIYDPGLMMRENVVPNQLHYWALHGFVQRAVHMPFFYAHRIAQQVHFYEELRGTPEHPGSIGFFANAPVHPLLDGRRLFLRVKGFRDPARGEDLRARVSNSMRCNTVRSILLRQKELLEAGEVGHALTEADAGSGTITQHYGTWELVAERLDNAGASQHLHGELAEHPELCTSDLLALIGELRGLVAAAPVVD